MLNTEKNDYFKRSSYYYITHFSKYIKPGAKRLGFSRFTTNVNITAFKNIDNSIVIVALNDKHYDIDLNFCIDTIIFQDTVHSHSIATYIIN